LKNCHGNSDGQGERGFRSCKRRLASGGVIRGIKGRGVSPATKMLAFTGGLFAPIEEPYFRYVLLFRKVFLRGRYHKLGDYCRGLRGGVMGFVDKRKVGFLCCYGTRRGILISFGERRKEAAARPSRSKGKAQGGKRWCWLVRRGPGRS